MPGTVHAGRWSALALTVVVATLLLPPLSAAGQAEGDSPNWEVIGPSAQWIWAAGVSPAWPADPFAIVVANPIISPLGESPPWRLMRTSDGGRSWELLGAPRTFENFAVGALPGGRRVIFGFTYESARRERGEVIYRSEDDGTTWQEVNSMNRFGYTPITLFSPAFGEDGVVLMYQGRRIWRSGDYGKTWQIIPRMQGQWVYAVMFAGASQPGLVYGTSITDELSEPFHDDPTEVSTDHERSIGVIVSQDGGATWAPTPAQPEIEGVPHRQVYDVVVSPSFAEDQTLFAYAWGPRTWNGGRTVSAGVFRSQDAGQSWQLLWQPPLPSVSPRDKGTSPMRFGRLAVSPTYATDQTVVLLEAVATGVRDAESGCQVARSEDGGLTWAYTDAFFAQIRCDRVVWRGDGASRSTIWLHDYLDHQPLGRSDDAGRTWQPGSTPYARTYGSQVGGVTILQDGTAFVGGVGGIWAYGPSARPWQGNSMPCQDEVSGGFARVLAAFRDVRVQLGCPLMAEQPARIREAIFPGVLMRRAARYYLVEESDLPMLYLGYTDEGPGFWRWFRYERREVFDNWSSAAHPAGVMETMDGAYQRFEGGVLLWLRHEGRPPSVLLAYGKYWEEVDDQDPSIKLDVMPSP